MAQNSDAVKQAMFEELQKILHPDSDQRKSAEARLAQLKFTEWYGVLLAEFTIDQQLHIGLRQLASVMLKQYVNDCWADGGDVVEEGGAGDLPAIDAGATPALLVNDEAKRRIKQILPEGLYDQNSKIRSVVAYCIANIALYDWPGDWQELFDVIVKCLSGTENSVDGAMKVLVEFTLELDRQVGECFQSYLYRNEAGQTSLVKTLLQSSEQTQSITSGQLLCRSLFSTDPLSNWFAAVSMSHALLENPAQKEQLLRVVLATSHTSKPVSLLEQCNQLLQQANCKFQSKVGLLMLLSVWLSHCQLAVRTFLSIPGTVAYLTGQISANEHGDNEYLVQGLCAFLMGICIQFNDNSVQEHQREFLCQLLVKRIGLDTYNKKLGEVSKHENYSKSAKQPQIRIAATTDLLLDYEFCRLFKALEAVISKTVNGFSSGGENITELTLSQEASGLVAQYKDIIREQDARLQALQQQLAHQEAKVRELSGALEQSQSSNAQLQDQNILLKAQLQAAADLRQQTLSSSASSPLHLLPAQGDHQQEVLEKRLSMLSLEQQTDRAKLAYYESENSRLLGELDQLRTRVSVAEGKANESGTELDKLRKDQEDLLELLTDQESKMQRYRMELKRVTGQSFDEDDDVDDELQAIEANDGEGKDAPSMANSSNHPGGFVC